MAVKYSSRIGKQYTASELKEFRSQLSTLKKQGLVGGKVNTRTARPSDVRGGKPLREYVAKYDDVLSGKATAVPLARLGNKSQQRKLYETVTAGGISPHAIVPHAADEGVSVHSGVVEISHTKGIHRLQIPIDYKNLPQYLKDLKQAAKDGTIPELRGPHYYGFNLHGGGSHTLFRNMEDLLDYMRNPRENISGSNRWLNSAIRSKDPKEMRDYFRNLEIVTTTEPVWWNRKEKREQAAKKKREQARNKRRAGKRKAARAAKKKDRST